MNSREGDCLIPFKEISVKCSKCYVDYWKSLRESSKLKIIEHDYSIEKVKTYRKYFVEEKTLLHFCLDCFKTITVSIPLSGVISEMKLCSRGGCVAAVLLGDITFEEICSCCVNFIVERFANNEFTIV